MVFESAEGLRVQEFEARVQSPRPGLRSLESRQDTPGNSQPEGELREANQQMREYLAELGHDLRTPLATICDALHVLSLDGDDGATREYVGDLMERQTQRIGLLIDDLLEASRIGQGKIFAQGASGRRERRLWTVAGAVRENITKHDELGEDQVYRIWREAHL
jgi:signal transduction histidine kinase